MSKYLEFHCMSPTMRLSEQMSKIHDAIERDEKMLANGETHVGEWELNDHLEFLKDKLTVFGEAIEATLEISKKYKN